MEMQIETAIFSTNTLYSSLEEPFCQRAESAGQTMSPHLYNILVSQSQNCNSQAGSEETDPGEEVEKSSH